MASQALQFMQACKALPGIQLSIGILPPANGNIWLAGNPGSSLSWDAYNHFMPPNGTSCAALNDPNVNPGGTGGTGLGTTTGGWGTLHGRDPAELEPFRGRQHLLRRRVGPVRQELGRLPELVGDRNSQRPGGVELRYLLIDRSDRRFGEASRLSEPATSMSRVGSARFIATASPCLLAASHQPLEDSAFFCLGWENTSMRRSCLGIAGGVLAFSLAGCGETTEEGPDQLTRGPIPRRSRQLRDDMAENAKNKSAATKGVEDKVGREEEG